MNLPLFLYIRVIHIAIASIPEFVDTRERRECVRLGLRGVLLDRVRPKRVDGRVTDGVRVDLVFQGARRDGVAVVVADELIEVDHGVGPRLKCLATPRERRSKVFANVVVLESIRFRAVVLADVQSAVRSPGSCLKRIWNVDARASENDCPITRK